MSRWLSAALLLAASAAPALADPALRWSPADTTVALGGEATLSIMLDDTLTVRTIEVYVQYDAGVISTVDGGPGALFDGFNLFEGFVEVNPETPGLWHGYCVILGAGDWTVGPGELFRWTVRGDTEGVAAISTWDLTLLPPGGGSYPEATLGPTTVTVGGGISSLPSDHGGATRLLVQPNPFNPSALISFDAGAGARGRLEVLDARGRRVATLARDAAAGARRWDGADERGCALPSGVYTFVLTGDDGRRTIARGALVR